MSILSTLKQMLFVFLLLPILVFAQLEPTWEIDFDQNVNWQKVTDYGYYVVHAGNSLYSVDPNSGEMRWEIKDVGILDESSYNNVSGTPFFTINASNGNIMGFNPAAGKTIFDTKSLGISSIEKLYPLLKSNKLMMIAKEGSSSETSLLVVDLETGKKLWSNTKEFGRLTGYTEINQDEFIMTSFAYIYRINSNTGETVWKESISGQGAPTSPLMGQLIESLGAAMVQEGDILINFHESNIQKDMVLIEAQGATRSTDSQGNEKVSYSVTYVAFDKNTGKTMWPSPHKVNAELGSVYFIEDGIIVSPNSSGKAKVNKLDYKTGEGLWGKKGNGFSLKGSIIDYLPIDEGILIVSTYDSDLQPDADLFVNLLDPNLGETKFDKPIKIKGGLEFTELTPSGLLYKTNLEMDVINIAEGSTRFNKPIRSASPFMAGNDSRTFSMPMAAKENLIYTYADKEKTLYEIDKQKGTAVAILEDIKFEGKEIPTAIELVDDGIILSSDQNILKTTFDGAVQYQSYYKPPSVSGFRKALLIAQAARAFYVGVAYKMSAAVYAGASQQTDNGLEGLIYDGVSKAYDEGGSQAMSIGKDAIAQVKERFKASAQSRDYLFMMTEEGKKEYAILQVSKNDGQVAEKIVIGRDKDPNYAIDDISNKLFYAQDDRKIVCYTFQ